MTNKEIIDKVWRSCGIEDVDPSSEERVIMLNLLEEALKEKVEEILKLIDEKLKVYEKLHKEKDLRKDLYPAMWDLQNLKQKIKEGLNTQTKSA